MDINEILNHDAEFRYGMLSRMQADCEYYLGNGNRHVKHLWASDEVKQIEYMKALWNSFPEGEKPEWLSYEKICYYESQIVKDIKIFDVSYLRNGFYQTMFIQAINIETAEVYIRYKGGVLTEIKEIDKIGIEDIRKGKPIVNIDPADSLPARCYVYSEVMNDICIVHRGDMGYYKADISADTPGEAKKLVDEKNAELGISKAQVEAMKAGSQFGWHTPAASPKSYDDNGTPIKPNNLNRDYVR